MIALIETIILVGVFIFLIHLISKWIEEDKKGRKNERRK